MDRYHVYSTDDMRHFRDEGEILRSDDLPWGRPEGGFMWAPDCRAVRDGKYYFFYPHPDGSRWNDTWKIGVCVSESPASGFRDLGFVEGIGGFCMIDPSIFIDDDGTNYLYYGGGGMSRAVILEDDMKAVREGRVYDIEGLEDFHEAPYVFKRNGLYYMTYSDNLPGRNRMHYATAKHPLGPFTHRGVYLELTGSDTSHGSVVEYQGRWYCFYHTCARSGRGTLRSVCADELFFEEDGSIRTVIQKGLPYEDDAYDLSPFPALRPDMSIRDEHMPVLTESGSAVLEEGRRLSYTKLDGGKGGRVSL
ncbi:MAG: family 43 glycosylhydrolase, partial [Clostridia bacterium]|nr:family 43 glycosylhydrolase [Clostridia bacterium]